MQYCGVCRPRKLQQRDFQMTRVLSYREPDDEGYFWLLKVGLESRRLSIIDLSPVV